MTNTFGSTPAQEVSASRDGFWLWTEIVVVTGAALVWDILYAMGALFCFWSAAFLAQNLKLWGRDQKGPIRTVWKNRIAGWALLKRPRGADFGLVLGGVFIVYAVDVIGGVLYDGSASAPGDDTLSTWAAAVSGENGLGMQVTYIALIVLIGPLCEEIIWRMYALRGLQAALKTTRISAGVALGIAVVTSTVLFSVTHTQYGLYGHVLVGIDGLIYALILIRTRNLPLVVLTHGLFNSLFIYAAIAG